MNRIAATLRLDVRNQYRQGFYAAAAVILVFLVFACSLLPKTAGFVVPAILLTNMAISTFAFLGAIVLLEKGEGTLESAMVTPLRNWEYLASKVVTLACLALVENTILTSIARASGVVAHVNWFWIVLASVLCAMLYVLLGFLTVVRCESINDFLIPMMLIVMVLELPGAVCFGMPEFKFLWLIPTYHLLWIFRAAFGPVPTVTLVIAITCSLCWIVAAFFVGRTSLTRYVAGQIGRS